MTDRAAKAIQPRRPFRRQNRVGHQHGDGHPADAARHRRDRAGDRGGLRIGDVADETRWACLIRHAAAATRLMPTSITIAPGLTQSPRTISG